MHWEKSDVFCIALVWQIAGLKSLADSIRAARRLAKYSVRAATIRSHLVQSAAARTNRTVDEVFISCESLLDKNSPDWSYWGIYRISALTNYGSYRFNILSWTPPSVGEIESRCIAHNLAS